MIKKKIFYAKHSINKNDINNVLKSLKYNKLTQGNEVIKFENNIKKYFKSKYSIATSNGTAALHLSGLGLGWKKNDIVITSPLTFVSTVNSIIFSGAKPELVDIDKNNFTIDLNKLEDKIKKIKKLKKFKLSTIIGVDYSGSPCDWSSLKFLSKKYNFKLLNDNCHAIGSKYKNDVGYAVKYADIVTHSYHAAKNITTGEGGAILTNNTTLFNKIKNLRSHGLKVNPKMYWKYFMDNVGYNYRLTDFQSSLGSSQIKQLNKFILTRRKNAEFYFKFFNDEKKYILPEKNKLKYNSFHFFPLQVKALKNQLIKDKFMKALNKKNIYLQVHYKPVFLFEYYKNKFKYNVKDFTNTLNFYNHEISLPTYPSLTSNEISYISKNIDILVNQLKK